MRSKALAMALSKKFKAGQVLFIASFGFSAPKTAMARKAMVALSQVSGFEKLAKKPKNAALIETSAKNDAMEKSFRNIGSIACISAGNLNPLAVLKSTYLVIENPQAALSVIEARFKAATKESEAK